MNTFACHLKSKKKFPNMCSSALIKIPLESSCTAANPVVSCSYLKLQREEALFLKSRNSVLTPVCNIEVCFKKMMTI